MFQAVLESLLSFGSFPEKDLLIFESKLEERKVLKNDFILKEGAICQAIYFMMEGSSIHLLPSPSAAETIVNLYTKGSWFTDYQSFTSQKPAVAYIQAFEDCRLAVIEINALHELILYSPIFFKAGKLLEMMQYTDVATLNLTPEQRYLDLLERRPALLRTFPLKLLASYLRIAPETLSRIRRRIK